MLSSLEHAKFTVPGILLLFRFALFPVMFISSDLYGSLDLHLTSLQINLYTNVHCMNRNTAVNTVFP